MTDSSKFFLPGDLVTADPALFGPSVHGTVFKVTGVPQGARGVNYTAKPVDPETGEFTGGRGLKGRGDSLVAYDPANPPSKHGVPLVLTPPMGSVVTVRLRNIDPATLFVVLGDARQANCVKLVRLGGDNGRYYPRVPVSTVTVVPLANLGLEA